jgi:glycosyltransferase involved in cell wall biosynthesis
MPALSVLIPVYNAATTLDLALGAIQAQTFRDWEAIVVDDGSTDATPRLLRAWGRRDERVRVLRNEPHAGLVASLNRALEAASAPLLARMDADDVSLPRRFERQVERMARGDVTVVGCRVRAFPEERLTAEARACHAWMNALVTPEEHDRELFVGCPIAPPTLLARTEAVRAAGGFRESGGMEGYDLCLRLWEAGGRLAKVPEELFLWRAGEDHTYRAYAERSSEAMLRCKAAYLCRSVLAGGKPAALLREGRAGEETERALREAGVRIVATAGDVDAALGLRGTAYGLIAAELPEARDRFRQALLDAGWTEGTEFRCVA